MEMPAINVNLGDSPERRFGGTYPNPTVPAKRSEFHEEEAVVGQTLHNYKTRTPDPDGKYVMVVEHEERIEKIKQPPTPAEIAAKKAEDKRTLIFVGSLVAGLFGLLGWFAWQDSKQPHVVEAVETPELES